MFNPNAFADPTCTTALSQAGKCGVVAPVPINPAVGNVYAYSPVGRDSFYGPGTFRFDAGLSRLFPIRERAQLELRFEAFNVINHVNLKIANIGAAAGINSSNFGQITSAPGAGFTPADTDPRILQFAVKLHW